MKIASGLTFLLLSSMAWGQGNNRETMPTIPDPPMLGPHFIRGHQAGAGAAGAAPLLTYHNGNIMATSVTQSIFWGVSWANPNFVGDKITGLDTWYNGEGGSDFAKTSDEYADSTAQQVTSSSQHLASMVDTSAAPKNAPRTSAILQEVCKVITNPVSNGYYAVYVDTPRGHANYCAWHSWGTCGNVPVQFAFFFNLDGDPGCDPQDSSGLHSQGLAALANVSGHELSEARTDPRGTGWFDSAGSENADKCAWTFGTSLLAFSNGSEWKIQGNWSNYAYTNNLGYANSSGQKGCIDGGMYPAVAP